jgi:hypothetical protein
MLDVAHVSPWLYASVPVATSPGSHPRGPDPVPLTRVRLPSCEDPPFTSSIFGGMPASIVVRLPYDKLIHSDPINYAMLRT